jgi:hypothetical protein
MPEQIEVLYNGRTSKRVKIVDGVVKNGNAFLVQCSITKVWMYCSEERLNKLVAKYRTINDLGKKFVSREGKKIRG